FTSTVLVVDGAVEENNTVLPMDDGTTAAVRFMFSPDGKHVIHFGALPDRRMGLFIDGKFISDGIGIRLANLTFTPDGRPFAWFQTVLDETHRPASIVISVDGRAAQQVD